MIIHNHMQNTMARKKERARERRIRISWNRRLSRINDNERRFQHLMDEVMLNTPVPGSYADMMVKVTKAHDDMMDSLSLAMEPIMEWFEPPTTKRTFINPYLKPMPGKDFLKKIQFQHEANKTMTSISGMALSKNPLWEGIIQRALEVEKEKAIPIATNENNEWGKDPMEDMKEFVQEMRKRRESRAVMLMPRDHGKTRMLQELTDFKFIAPKPRKIKRKRFADDLYFRKYFRKY